MNASPHQVCKDGVQLVIMDKDTGMLDSDDVLGKVNASLASLDNAAKVSFVESVPEGGVLAFTVEWEEGEVVEKGKKKARAEPALEDKEVSQNV